MDTNKLKVVPDQALVYDIDEIDGAMYMFSHLAGGSVIFRFEEAIDPARGAVLLNGRPHTDWEITKFIFNDCPILLVHVRGYLNEYDTTAQIRISGFETPDGRQMDPQEFTIQVLPRRNSYPEKYRGHDETALKAACESAVLLKNDGMLPLKGDAPLSLFGRGVAEYRRCAVGAARINPRGCRSLEQAAGETSRFSLNRELLDFYRVPNNRIPPEDMLDRALAQSEAALVILTRGTGENIDNRPIPGEYYLSDEEDALLAAVTQKFEKVAVILNVGYPIDVRFLEKYAVNACLYTGLPGMFGAEALFRLLDGRSNPSGRLPDTWPLDYYDTPASRNFLNFSAGEKLLQTDDLVWSQICYEEGLYVGYRYFLSFDKPAAFPFGYGLSYTEFEQQVTDFRVEDDRVKVTVAVKNTGDRAGKDVAQLYVSKPDAGLEQPAAELAAFGKTAVLEPGQAQALSLEIPLRHLASYRESTAEWVLLPGRYTVSLGRHAGSLIIAGSFPQDGERIFQKAARRVAPPQVFDEISRKSVKSWPKGDGTFTSAEPLLRNQLGHFVPPPSPLPKAEASISFGELAAAPEKLPDFVAQLTDDELCRLQVLWSTSWQMNEKKIAGIIKGLQKYGMPDYVLADGNNGVNVARPNIGMPSSCMVAASFDTQLAYDVGRVIAEEALDNGVDLILGPGMNLHRNLLNGRNAEYFSEDPLLAGYMAGHQTKGMQDAGVSGCIKHVAANNCEAVRKRSNSLIRERTLRELYIRPYEYAMEIEPADTVMTGYNAVNGKFCDEDYELLEGIFREELGFDGFAMSDWNSYDTSDTRAMVRAGISVLTPGSDDGRYVEPLKKALQAGEITRGELQRNVMRLLRVLCRRLKVRDYGNDCLEKEKPGKQRCFSGVRI